MKKIEEVQLVGETKDEVKNAEITINFTTLLTDPEVGVMKGIINIIQINISQIIRLKENIKTHKITMINHQNQADQNIIIVKCIMKVANIVVITEETIINNNK